MSLHLQFIIKYRYENTSFVTKYKCSIKVVSFLCSTVSVAGSISDFFHELLK